MINIESKNKEGRVVDAGRHRQIRWWVTPWVVGLCVTIAAGCQTSQDQRMERAYEVALQRMVHSHVYEMSCQALLPLAQQLLWESGYGEAPPIGDGDALRSEWKQQDNQVRSRYTVHAHRVGLDQCAVQFIHHERSEQAETEMRDVSRELEFLEFVDQQDAQYIRSRAREEAHQQVDRMR